MMEACPCGSAQDFAECCGPFLSGLARPASAVELMRSRYAAYCRRDGAYLLKTWHPRTRPAGLDFSGDDTEWTGLAILGHEAGEAGDVEGVVEFAATYLQDGSRRRLHETSRFIREAGEWLYVDGDIHPGAKPGRNDPCPCGSGKKFKKCCGR